MHAKVLHHFAHLLPFEIALHVFSYLDDLDADPLPLPPAAAVDQSAVAGGGTDGDGGDTSAAASQSAADDQVRESVADFFARSRAQFPKLGSVYVPKSRVSTFGHSFFFSHAVGKNKV